MKVVLAAMLWFACGILARGLAIPDGITDTKSLDAQMTYEDCVADRKIDRGYNNIIVLTGPIGLIVEAASTNAGEDGFQLSEDDCKWATKP